jgi:ribonuclease HII
MHAFSWHADEAHGLPALGRPAQHPVPRLRRARTAAARVRTRGAGATPCWPGSTITPPRRALAERFDRTAPLLRRDTARACHRCHRASPSSLSSWAWLGRARPGGRRRRGRPRPAGRAGGGGGGDPRRAAADPRPGRLQDAVAAPARARCTTRSAPSALCCSIAEASASEIDRLNILQATLLAMQRAVDGCGCRRTACWSTATACRRCRCRRRHRQGRRQGAGDLGGVDPRQGAPRPAVRELHERYPGLRLRGHKGYPRPSTWQALREHGPCPSTAQLCAGARRRRAMSHEPLQHHARATTRCWCACAGWRATAAPTAAQRPGCGWRATTCAPRWRAAWSHCAGVC